MLDRMRMHVSAHARLRLYMLADIRCPGDWGGPFKPVAMHGRGAVILPEPDLLHDMQVLLVLPRGQYRRIRKLLLWDEETVPLQRLPGAESILPACRDRMPGQRAELVRAIARR